MFKRKPPAAAPQPPPAPPPEVSALVDYVREQLKKLHEKADRLIGESSP